MTILTALLAAACWPARPSVQEIVGVWQADHSFGSETLVLSNDGRYTQILVEPSGRKIENSGQWKVQPSRETLAGSKVILRKALVFANPFGNRDSNPQPQDWELEAVHEWGRTVLTFNPDLPGFQRK